MDKFWKNRNVMVTGPTGLLGSWLVSALAEKGANVVALIRDRVPGNNLERSSAIERINVVNGGIEDYFLLKRCINEYEIQTVYHLAAQTIVTVANQDPLSTFESNIKGTWNILEAARHARFISEVIVASSDKAYGEKEKLPYKETDTLEGAHPYDVSKSCADLIAQAYFKTYSLPVCITRCANLYGGGDLNFSRIIPGTIRSAFYNQPPIIRSNGKFLRDYFYVEDAVSALMLLVEKLKINKLSGEAFNFSSGIHVNVLELVDKILKLMNKKLQPKILDQTKHEIKDQYLSIAKAKEVLGWQPSFDLESGLAKTIEWYNDYLSDLDNRG